MNSDLKDIFIPIAIEQGIDKAVPINVRDIIFDFRTTYKCMTCPKYGKTLMCPPHIPEFDYFKRLIESYRYGLLIYKQYKYRSNKVYEKLREESGPRMQEVLLALEQQAFQRGYYWNTSFTGGSCRLCKICNVESGECIQPSKSRIAMEAVGIDVINTCRKIGLDIDIRFPHPSKNNPLYRVGLFLLE